MSFIKKETDFNDVHEKRSDKDKISEIFLRKIKFYKNIHVPIHYVMMIGAMITL